MLKLGIGAQASLQHIDHCKQKPWIHWSTSRQKKKKGEGGIRAKNCFYKQTYSETAASVYEKKRRAGVWNPTKKRKMAMGLLDIPLRQREYVKHAAAALPLNRKSFTGSHVALHFSRLLHDGCIVLMDLIFNRDSNIKRVVFNYWIIQNWHRHQCRPHTPPTSRSECQMLFFWQ